jgi:hypothetical protein
MSEGKYTPRPWTPVKYKGRIIILGGGEGRHICDIEAWPKEQDSNAALISAAPDLLEALEELVNAPIQAAWSGARVCNHEEEVEIAICKANAALAKAKGE